MTNTIHTNELQGAGPDRQEETPGAPLKAQGAKPYTRLLIALLLFLGALAVSWFTRGTGVIANDPSRNISIPAELTVPLQVQAAYNDSKIFVRYRWPAARAGIFHDVLVFRDGKWITKGDPVPGSEPDGLHEDRVAMMVDDGGVPEFEHYGAYITVGAGLAGLTDAAPKEVTKYLPKTRNRLGQWDDKAPDDTQAKLRKAGYFLDLWHWRAGRSNPVRQADDQFVGAERGNDAGSASFSTNWDKDLKQPRMMFDRAATGYHALNFDQVVSGKVSQDSVYALVADKAVPYDPNAGWKNGDVLPRRLLRPASGSRGDIAVVGEGRWKDGYWDVTLSRALDTGNPLDDKILREHGTYTVAFAIHRDATGGRWHYVSLPHRLGLSRDGDIVAAKFTGDLPSWSESWTDVTLFYPGQVTWPMLNSQRHAGAESIAKGVPVRFRHTPQQLAHYGTEQEFWSQIRWQWMMTMLAGLLLIFSFGAALHSALKSRKGA